MSTRGLVQLEDLRRDEVERASRELAALRTVHERALEAQRVALGVQEQCARALTAARECFATARTVASLRAAEAGLGVAHDALARARERAALCRLRVLEAARALAGAEARLRAGEVARRSVARTLEQRAADVSLRAERRHEDEADDAFRGQFQARRRAPPVRG
jgi:hypothetical protein